MFASPSVRATARKSLWFHTSSCWNHTIHDDVWMTFEIWSTYDHLTSSLGIGIRGTPEASKSYATGTDCIYGCCNSVETLVDQIILEASHRRTGRQNVFLDCSFPTGTHIHKPLIYLLCGAFRKNVVTAWLILYVSTQILNHIIFGCFAVCHALVVLLSLGSFPWGTQTIFFPCCRIAFGSESISQARLGNHSRNDTICFRTQLFLKPFLNTRVKANI